MFRPLETYSTTNTQAETNTIEQFCDCVIEYVLLTYRFVALFLGNQNVFTRETYRIRSHKLCTIEELLVVFNRNN